MSDTTTGIDDYARVERAIRYLERHAGCQPALAEVAAAVGLSEFHFHRLFTRWAGTTPKRFLQFLTAEHARRILEESRSVLEATYAAGLSGPGRLHDLMVAVDALTPGELRRGGAGVEIAWGVHPTPFGEAMIATTPRGVCATAFLDGEGAGPELEALRRRWPGASLAEDAAATAPVARRILEGTRVGGNAPLRLHLAGTNFQLRVWRALLEIPPGRVLAYGDVARAVGQPQASRAVGGAVGANPVAWLIPCHRVIRGAGATGDYRWGAARKRAMLGWEAARTTAIGD